MYRKYLDKKTKQQKQKTLTTSVLSVMLTVLLFVPLACAANTQKLVNSLAICENPGEEPWNLPLLLTENGCMEWKSINESNTSYLFQKGEYRSQHQSYFIKLTRIKAMLTNSRRLR